MTDPVLSGLQEMTILEMTDLVSIDLHEMRIPTLEDSPIVKKVILRGLHHKPTKAILRGLQHKLTKTIANSLSRRSRWTTFTPNFQQRLKKLRKWKKKGVAEGYVEAQKIKAD